MAIMSCIFANMGMFENTDAKKNKKFPETDETFFHHREALIVYLLLQKMTFVCNERAEFSFCRNSQEL